MQRDQQGSGSVNYTRDHLPVDFILQQRRPKQTRGTEHTRKVDRLPADSSLSCPQLPILILVTLCGS